MALFTQLCHWTGLRAVYKPFVKNLCIEQVTQILVYIKNYFMLVAFISPVTFSKIVFAVWNFVRSLKLYYKNNFCQSLLLKSHEIRLFCRKLNSWKRGNSLSVLHINSPKYSNDQGGKLDWNWLKFYGERRTGLCGVDKIWIGPDRTGSQIGSRIGSRIGSQKKKKVLKKKNNQIVYKIIINKKIKVEN